MKPHVDAADMEAVVTLRKATTLLVLLKLRQANGAFRHIRVGLGGVHERRERLENRSVETANQRRGGGGGVHVENQMRAAAAGGGGGGMGMVMGMVLAVERPVQIPGKVVVKADHENDDDEPNHNHADHNLEA